MITLHKDDVAWCLRRLPTEVREALRESNGSLILAGGFIRACIAREEINDIDLLCNCKDTAEKYASKLGDERTWKSDNAYTVKTFKVPLQLIHRWTYDNPRDVIPSFDFTIAKAAIWHSAVDGWVSEADDRFYIDLAAKRLVYTSPKRNEDAGGSILRVLKFYQRGYRIPLASLGAVIARLCQSVEWNKTDDEQRTAQVITSLLKEVDPNTGLEAIEKELA